MGRILPRRPSSQIALRATVPVAGQGRTPLLSSLTPPQLPTVNTDVDLPLTESVMNKIMRDATQELIQGAKWVGKQGWQAWNNYWNPQPTPGSSKSPRSDLVLGAELRDDRMQPTSSNSRVRDPAGPKEPGLVSILDIETIGDSVNLHPVATFAAPQGCGFLSFPPTGLLLFTASTKGDVQTVWDLMRIQYTKSSQLQASGTPQSSGGRVRQVAQFTRMTVARIVDVAWTKPNGQRIAMVTERGHRPPPGPSIRTFTWPPPRRRARAQDGREAPQTGLLLRCRSPQTPCVRASGSSPDHLPA